MSTGFALGGFMTPLVSWLIEDFGWRNTAIASAIILFVVGQILATLFVRRPQDRGLMKDGEPPPVDGSASRVLQQGNEFRHRDFTVREAMRTKAFWGLALAHGAPLLVVSGVFVHFASLVIEIEGLTVVHASLAYTAMNVAQLIGQVGMGYMGDRFSKRALLIPAMFGHAARSGDARLCRLVRGGDAGSDHQRSGLGIARPPDHRSARRLFRRVQLRQDHGLVVDRDVDLHDHRRNSSRASCSTPPAVTPFPSWCWGSGPLSGVLWVGMSGRPRLPGVRVIGASGPLSRAQPIAMFRPNRPAANPSARSATQRSGIER